MLCSDGLSGLISPRRSARSWPTSGRANAPKKLIRLALGRPHFNITCVIADIVPPTRSPAPPQIVGAAAIDRNAKSRGGAAARAALGSSASGTPATRTTPRRTQARSRNLCSSRNGPRGRRRGVVEVDADPVLRDRDATSSSTRASRSRSARGGSHAVEVSTSRCPTSRPWTASASTRRCCAPRAPTSTHRRLRSITSRHALVADAPSQALIRRGPVRGAERGASLATVSIARPASPILELTLMGLALPSASPATC